MVVIILSASAACGFFFLRLKEIFLGRQIQGCNFSRTKKKMVLVVNVQEAIEEICKLCKLFT